MDTKKLYNLVERLDAFEERCKVSFENISIQVANGCKTKLWVVYELRSSVGNELAFDRITVHCTIYSDAGKIMDTSEDYFKRESFWGFDVGGREYTF